MNSNPYIVASIEARMGSSRFPGKILADINGQPALTRLVNRLKRSKLINAIVLATTTRESDDQLVEWASNEDVSIYRGSEEDVLSRVVEAHHYMGSDIIVEVTGDCILLDPEIIDLGIETFLHHEYDVVTNVRYPSYPMGVDVQVFKKSLLSWVAENIADPAVREHVSLYFYEHPEAYRVHHLIAPSRWKAPDCRLQLDYAEDHQLISEIYHHLEPLFGDSFGVEEIIQFLKKNPDLIKINQHCIEKTIR